MIYIPPWQMRVKTVRAGDLPVGSVVKLMEGGSAVEYLVVHQGKPSDLYDDSCDGTWLLRKDIHSLRLWDSGNGDDGYKTSAVNAWLNGDFFNSLGSAEKGAIRQVTIPYCSMSLGNPIRTLACKVALPSAYELGWTAATVINLPADGTKLSYFESGALHPANRKRIALFNGYAIDWWLRSIRTSDTGNAYICLENGGISSDEVPNTDGIRPMVVLPGEALFNTRTNRLMGLPAGYVDPTTSLTWVFDESPAIPNSYYKEVNISFTAGGTTYDSITVQGNEATGNGGMIHFNDDLVYAREMGTFSENKRTISLYAPATGDALTLLRRFATPKS